MMIISIRIISGLTTGSFRSPFKDCAISHGNLTESGFKIRLDQDITWYLIFQYTRIHHSIHFTIRLDFEIHC